MAWSQKSWRWDSQKDWSQKDWSQKDWSQKDWSQKDWSQKSRWSDWSPDSGENWWKDQVSEDHWSKSWSAEEPSKPRRDEDCHGWANRQTWRDEAQTWRDEAQNWRDEAQNWHMGTEESWRHRDQGRDRASDQRASKDWWPAGPDMGGGLRGVGRGSFATPREPSRGV
jgi:hypothetical protein